MNKVDTVIQALALPHTDPGHIQGWCSQAKASKLVDLIREHRPARIVEIGVFGGRSLLPMAAAAEEYGATVFGIDPWMKGPCLEGTNDPANDEWWAKQDFNAIFAKYLANVEAHGLGGVITTIRETDELAVWKFDDESIGMLHVDGSHAPEVSRRHVDQWGPKLRPGGILVMDDVAWPEQKPTVEFLDATYTRLGLFEVRESGESWAWYRKGGV